LPAGSRGTSDTIISLPGLFADIDFANSKENNKRYPPDFETALALIDSFEFAPFFIQNSGNGLHVLYKADTPLVLRNRTERRHAKFLFKAFSRRLARHFKDDGYVIDNVQDLARVFRAPGTFNHKRGLLKPVKEVRFDANQTFDWAVVEDWEKQDAAKSIKKTDNKKLANHAAICEACLWYASTTGEHAATCDEPNWYAAASITGRCEAGEETFHKYSQNHPGYDREEAAKKFIRAIKEAGPRTCEEIRNTLGNEETCDVCHHWQRIKSPIQLGYIYDHGTEGPIPLGFSKDGGFVLFDQVRQIIITSSAQQLLSQQYLVGLASSEFWSERFPSSGRTSFNGMKAGEAIIEACRKAGPFIPSKVRGRGVWLEKGKVTVNLGQSIEGPTEHLYLCFEPLALADTSKFETKDLLETLKLLPWRNPEDAIFALGWLALAPICGALEWRPHLFVYGPPNSGKTTLHRLVTGLLQPLVISADGQSTEAGIRQVLGPDSLPIAIDEFETDQRQGRLKAIIRLARSASSAETTLLRGTPEGKAMQFSLRTMFFFSAINVAGMSPADETRIIPLELTRHANDVETGRQLETGIAKFTGLGPQWGARMASLAIQVREAIDIFRVELPNFDSRHRTNMATLLSGAFVALNARAPSQAEAAKWAAEYAMSVERHGRSHDRDDAEEALNHILQFPVRDGLEDHYALGHWIGLGHESVTTKQPPRNDIAPWERILRNHDIKVIGQGENQGWLLRNGSAAIDRIYEGTRWEGGAWRRALLQIPGAFSPQSPVYFPSIQNKSRCVGLPLDRIPDPLNSTIRDQK
jgi:energy-coupling factor transporter ATP-binding protein EcfA2